MDEQTVQKICEEYADKTIKTKDICKRYGVHPAQLVRFIIEHGGQPRRPTRVGEKRNGENSLRKCPRCHKVIEIKGARFCPFCGADIRQEAELLIEMQEKLMSLSPLLPQNVRDELQTTVVKTITYLKKGC